MTREQRTQESSDKQASLQSDKDFLESLTELRRTLHKNPEVAFEEKETARILTDFLAQWNLEPVATDIAGHGLLFHLEGKKDGPRILLEADLDALPLTEDTGKPYASQTDGTHHACGHDGHMAMLAGALAHLAQNRAEVPGEVYALFQPAEETGQGAERVMKDSRVRDLDVDGVYGIHNLPGHPLGTVVIREGTMASASVGLHFRFQGETSHAAAPHKGKSAVAALSQLALRAPGIPAEVLPYGEPALVTPIHMDAGRVAFGTAAGSGSARFTLRAASDDSLQAVRRRMQQEAESLARGHGLDLEVEEVEPFPATVNDPDAVALVLRTAKRLDLAVTKPEAALAWSEDFGHFNARWSGALVCLGSGEEQPELHRPDFDFPDRLLAIGVGFWVSLIMDSASRGGQG